MVVHGRRYLFRDSDQDPYLVCTFENGGYRYWEHPRCDPYSIYRGMLLITEVYGSYHRLDVMIDGTIRRYSERLGTVEDLEET